MYMESGPKFWTEILVIIWKIGRGTNGHGFPTKIHCEIPCPPIGCRTSGSYIFQTINGFGQRRSWMEAVDGHSSEWPLLEEYNDHIAVFSRRFSRWRPLIGNNFLRVLFVSPGLRKLILNWSRAVEWRLQPLHSWLSAARNFCRAAKLPVSF